MWRAIVLVTALAACGDNLHPVSQDAGLDDALVDAAPPDGPAALGPCLDRPTEITKVPTGKLPCELISPAFQP
jgi:hypothetical protein